MWTFLGTIILPTTMYKTSQKIEKKLEILVAPEEGNWMAGDHI